MKRTKLIGDVFHSVVPVGTAGKWSVGYSGHTNQSSKFTEDGFEITDIRNILNHTTPPEPGAPIMNDVYIDYNTTALTGQTQSIYVY